MTKSFRSERVFHDSRGWFVAMRPSDARIVRDLPVPGRHLVRDHGIVVGPFVERSDLDTWFVNYVGRYGVTRMQDLRAA
ncbi:MAG: hypothetical protein GWP66_00125 [Gammaproteobacteria bacterium]|jgi:hypothetical protein|nr:hypothetical protein [Gammaproteobacteria bacterium]